MSKLYSIKEAAKWLGLSEVYIRRMIQKEKIATSKQFISENVWKHEISEEELISFRKQSSTRTIRADGRNKYTVYANLSEYAQLRKLIEEANLAVITEKANKPEDTKKRYLARKTKKAQKA
jgi:hypothetical protein